MADLIYFAIISLDGYVEDQYGRFDWAAPDPEVHQFINELVRPVGTYLYGRGMYQTMHPWETDPGMVTHSPLTRDFAAIWLAAEKIVYSATLAEVATAQTQIEHIFDPQAIRRLKRTAEKDISIGGPGLASHAFAAGLVDQCYIFVNPVVVGGGKPGFPKDIRLNFQLEELRAFASGVVFLRYRSAASDGA